MLNDWIGVIRTIVASMMVVTTFSVQAQTNEREGIRIELPVLPGLVRYVDMLEHPAFLALALENNGLSPSLSSRMTIEDSRGLRVRNAVLHYKGKQGSTYNYEAGATLDLGVGETSISFPFTVDVGALSEGKVVAQASPPLSKFFPQELRDRVQIKAQLLANPAMQQKVLEYLDGISKKAGGGQTEKIFELILIDAYNQGGAIRAREPGRDRGDAESLSDQILLLITLVIWLVIVPLAIVGQYVWRKHKSRGARQ